MRNRMILAWVCLSLAGSAGCGPRAGTVLYFLGMGKGQDIPADYELPQKPLLILVDDEYDLVHPPHARDALVDALSKELRDRDLADKITSNEELAKVRQNTPNFDKRGAREVGELVKADIVLWLRIRRFTLPDDLEAAMQPCFFGVALKVLDVKASKREDVALWPKEREGKFVEVKVSPHDLRAAGNIREAHRVMAEKLAQDVAKLFYTHEEDAAPR